MPGWSEFEIQPTIDSIREYSDVIVCPDLRKGSNMPNLDLFITAYANSCKLMTCLNEPECMMLRLTDHRLIFNEHVQENISFSQCVCRHYMISTLITIRRRGVGQTVNSTENAIGAT